MIETLKLEEGKVTMCNVPFIFTFTKSIYYTQKELQKVAGDSWKKIAYECGKTDVTVLQSNYFAMFHDDPEVKNLISDRLASFEFCVDEFNKMGKGKLEIIEEDAEKFRFILRMHFCGIALAYLEHEMTLEPICYNFAGIFAAGTNSFFPGVEAVETKCMAKGDPYCEFIIEVSKK
jgi:predicted hydrocarbon binding protein